MSIGSFIKKVGGMASDPFGSVRNAVLGGGGGGGGGGSYGGPNEISGFGISYKPITASGKIPGLDGATADQLNQVPTLIIQGAGRVQAEKQRAYESLFRTRALGIESGFRTNERKLGGETDASGMTSSFARLGSFQREAGLTEDLSRAAGESEFGYRNDMAELAGDTYSSLVEAKQFETTLAKQLSEGAKAREAAKKARDAALFGDVLGLAGTIGGAMIGGPAGAAVGAKVGSAVGSKVKTPDIPDAQGNGAWA